MIEKFIDFVKGVFKKMFDSTTIAKKAFNLDSLMSEKMSTAIATWKSIYEGNAPWVSEFVGASDTPAQVANEFARLTTLEMETQITGSKRADYINKIYQEFIAILDEKLEIGNATGGVYFKPYVSDNKVYINAIAQGDFIPIAFDGDGNLTSVIFVDTFTAGKYIYSRLEWQRVEEDKLIIINKAFCAEDKNTLGNEVSLTEIDRWAKIEPVIVINNMPKIFGGFYKVPKANHIDKTSPLGVSVYSRALKELEKLDKQKSRLDWEYQSGERKTYVDTMALNETQIIKNGKTVNKKANVDKRLFKSLSVGKEDFFEDYSPEIRDEAYLRGLDKYKKEVEFACDLAYGTISDPASIEKTATEIKGSKQKSYAVVTKMQAKTEKALNDLIESVDVLCTLYGLAPAGDYEVSYKWDDSLVVDAETERQQDIRDVNLGIMTKAQYRAKWYGETIEEAQKNLPQEADVIE